MKFLRELSVVVLSVLALGGSAATWAADASGAPGANAAPKEAPKDLVLRGDAKCTTCHDESDSPKVLAIGKTRHGVKADGRTPSCTDCHGASEVHIKEAGRGGKKTPPPDVVFGGKNPSSAQDRSKACLTCHEKDPARNHWAGSQHEGRDVACTNCHNVHTGHDRVLNKMTQSEVCFTCHKTERSLTHRMSTHPLDAGQMSCSDCHNPHGSVGPKLLVKSSVSETCFTCHAEKRGPFLWEHTPVVEDCLNCHTPHGSTNAPLLKARAPWLCEQCHQSTGSGHYGYFDANALPGGAAVSGANTGSTSATNPTNPVTGQLLKSTAPNPRVAYRGCVNCHSQIHGSNHPAGSRFVR